MTTWGSLRRDEERLFRGLRVLDVLRAIESNSTVSVSVPSLTRDQVEEALASLAHSSPEAVDAVLEKVAGREPTMSAALQPLIEELDETLYWESRLLDAER